MFGIVGGQEEAQWLKNTGKYLLKNINRYQQAHTHFQTLSLPREPVSSNAPEAMSRASTQILKAEGQSLWGETGEVST